MSYPSGGDATLKADRTTTDSKLHHKSLVWIEGGEGWLFGGSDDCLRSEREEIVKRERTNFYVFKNMECK